VAQPVGIGARDVAAQAMMAEQQAQSTRSHSPTPASALQGNEQGGRVSQRSFQALIFFEDLADFLRQGQDPLLISFAENPQVCLGEAEILHPQSQDFAAAQAIEQHQAHQGQIAKGAKAAPELGDFLCQGHDDAPGLA
jgi:hypothetical protein